MAFGQDEKKTCLPLLFHIKNEEFVSLFFCFSSPFWHSSGMLYPVLSQSFHSEIKELKSPAFPDVINYHQEN